MLKETRFKNSKWNLVNLGNDTVSASDAHLAVLMDIRDELQTLNRVFSCKNTLNIPDILRSIRANTNRPKRKKRK